MSTPILFHDPQDMQAWSLQLRAQQHVVGFIPTMGALHEGHLALVRAAQQQCSRVVVSIFVNPTQFGPTEDYQAYPRTLEQDCALLEREGVHAIFAPQAAVMYPSHFQTMVIPGNLAQVLCGASRPGHFQGVCTIVLKLLNMVQCHRLYLGQKDFQQVTILQRMILDFNVPVQLCTVPTARNAQGLALSSRNAYLTPEQYPAALLLSKALTQAQQQFQQGQRNAQALREGMHRIIAESPLIRVDYIDVVHPDTLQSLNHISDHAVAVLAVFVGTTRLIDNTILQ